MIYKSQDSRYFGRPPDNNYYRLIRCVNNAAKPCQLDASSKPWFMNKTEVYFRLKEKQLVSMQYCSRETDIAYMYDQVRCHWPNYKLNWKNKNAFKLIITRFLIVHIYPYRLTWDLCKYIAKYGFRERSKIMTNVTSLYFYANPLAKT